MTRLPNVLLLGTGEYTTGLVNGTPSVSDKSCGIVALTIFDLRSRGLINKSIGLVGTRGTKMPMIRQHLVDRIEKKYGLDVTCRTWPEDDVESDRFAYQKALQSFEAGDLAIITTPDATHFEIAMECIKHGLHVLIAKPVVRSINEHVQLINASINQSVLCCAEMHKRWDPFYVDASDRIASGSIGGLTYYYAYMSQPKSQLATFQAWISDGTTDISYYLNSHHIDFLTNALSKGKVQFKPISVHANASKGLANKWLKDQSSNQSIEANVDDSITLSVSFVDSHDSSNVGVAVFTSCWTGPLRPDAHTQQTQHFVGHAGEIHVDQAHRGYRSTTDEAGVASHNPLFFKYTPDAQGKFAGQGCYGYGTFEHFVRAATRWNVGETQETVKQSVVSVDSKASMFTTAILEAGRRSLDERRTVQIKYDEKNGAIQLE